MSVRLRLLRKWAFVSPFNMPKKPDLNEEILRTLVLIWQTIGRTNRILRETEENNQRRHIELMAILNPKASHIKFVFGKPELK